MTGDALQEMLALGLTHHPGVTAAEGDRLLDYVKQVLSWNRTYNLTGCRSEGAFLERHVLDSLAVSSLLEQGSRVWDLGSGAGLPGVPLALIRDDIKVDLVEISPKKAAFLRLMVHRYGLESRVRVIQRRLEELPGREAPHKRVLSRALAPLDRAFPLVWPLVARGGCYLAFKGAQAEAECQALRHSRAWQEAGSPAAEIMSPLPGCSTRVVRLWQLPAGGGDPGGLSYPLWTKGC
ncbi:MAG: 16S rRNA (guanine(527)-N(7))-methyltransferase RsmG [Magnetococcus sp. WYHC-3]